MRAVRTTGVHREPAPAAERVSQLLAGERVEPREAREEGGVAWVRVAVAGQPSALDPAGYPGWVLRDDLVADDEAVVAVARTYLGTPYAWGGLTREGVDCSGLVHVGFRVCGVVVPRDAADQARASTPVAIGEERPGDLWFFARDGAGGRVTHVGFVTADDTMLHATDSGPRGGVVEERLRPERRSTLVSAGRL